MRVTMMRIKRMMTMTPDVDEAGSIRNDCTIIVTLKRIGFRSYNFCFCKVKEAKVHIPNSSRQYEEPDSMEHTQNLLSRCRSHISCFQLPEQPIMMMVAMIMIIMMMVTMILMTMAMIKMMEIH